MGYVEGMQERQQQLAQAGGLQRFFGNAPVQNLGPNINTLPGQPPMRLEDYENSLYRR